MDYPPIILHGNNLDSNRGCQALRLTTQTILDRYLPEHARLHANLIENDEPQFLGPLRDPKSAGQIWETRDRRHLGFYSWGAKVLSSRIWRNYPAMKVHDASAKAAAVVAVGGDNLSYDYGFLATLLFFSPLDAAVRQGVPTMIWAASVGSFAERPYWEQRFAELLRAVDVVGVRESVTEEYLDRLGVRDNVARVIDPAFLLPIEHAELPPEIELALQQGAVGVNLAPLMTRYGRLSRQSWQQNAKALLMAVGETTTLPIVLIPHVMMSPRIFPDNDDFLFMQMLHQELPAEFRRRVFLYDAREDSCMQIKGVISRLRVFISSRFHAAVGGLSSNVPTLCLGYGIKARGLYRDLFGHDQWLLHIKDFDLAACQSRLQQLLDAEPEVRSELQSVTPEYSQGAWKSGELLSKLLSARQASEQASQVPA